MHGTINIKFVLHLYVLINRDIEIETAETWLLRDTWVIMRTGRCNVTMTGSGE